MFLNNRQVLSFGCFVFDFWVLRFRDLGAPFSSLGASFSSFRCFIFKFWVLRFRDLGASFSRYGCFMLGFQNYSSQVVVPLIVEKNEVKEKLIEPVVN